MALYRAGYISEHILIWEGFAWLIFTQKEYLLMDQYSMLRDERVE